MKKLITRLAVALFLSFGSAHAALIDTITGFSSSDTYTATVLTENAILNFSGAVPNERVMSITNWESSNFTHDYEFRAVGDSFVSIAATTENTLIDVITSFTMAIYNATDFNSGGGPLAFINSSSVEPSGSVAFSMAMGNDYLIRLTGTSGDDGNYTMQLAAAPIPSAKLPAVPIPAAIWLFGTALIGFVGMSRKTTVS
jgi:hypothetical protein